jgi:hypothetical protein
MNVLCTGFGYLVVVLQVVMKSNSLFPVVLPSDMRLGVVSGRSFLFLDCTGSSHAFFYAILLWQVCHGTTLRTVDESS